MCRVVCNSVTGGELFEDIVAREFYSEADARYYSLLALTLSNCGVLIFFSSKPEDCGGKETEAHSNCNCSTELSYL